MDRLLAIGEVAEMTRLSENAIRWMRHKDDGPPCGKLGRRLVWREPEVIDWVNARFDADPKQAS